jgi:hypothetical protein
MQPAWKRNKNHDTWLCSATLLLIYDRLNGVQQLYGNIIMIVFTDSMNSALTPARLPVSWKYVGTTDTVGGSGTKNLKDNTNNYAKILL